MALVLRNGDSPQLKVLITEAEIQQRVKELGQQITRDYCGKQLHLIYVLKGACVFLADLIRHGGLSLSEERENDSIC